MTLLLAAILAHSFYDAACCSDRDCHPVPCAEVVDIGQGWIWHDNRFTKAMLRASEDGSCHVCISGNYPRCIYLPSSS